MSDALLLLRLEHGNLSQLLDLVDEQSELMASGSDCDFDLLATVAEYLSGYPDKCHHPVEDLIAQRLKVRDPDAAANSDKLVDEHTKLERLTAAFSQAVSEAGSDEMAGLAATMKGFVATYRKHMAMEEEHFFPAAARSLSDDDWEEIDFNLFDNPDPLVNPATSERFHRLRERINSLAQDSQKRARRLRELREVGELSSVQAFNDFLNAADYVYRLDTKPAGGYRVTTGNRKLIDIPDCDIKQALLYAYFFVQGLDESPA